MGKSSNRKSMIWVNQGKWHLWNSMNGKLPGKWRSKGDRYPKIVTSQTYISSSLEAVRTIFVKCDRYFFMWKNHCAVYLHDIPMIFGYVWIYSHDIPIESPCWNHPGALGAKCVRPVAKCQDAEGGVPEGLGAAAETHQVPEIRAALRWDVWKMETYGKIWEDEYNI